MKGIYMIPDFQQLQASAEFAAEHGLCFEYNDFFIPTMLENTSAIKERLGAYRSLGRDISKDTLHGAFYDVTVFSSDPRIREVSLLRMRQSMEIAKELGVRAVIFHGNYLPFLRKESYDAMWLDYTEDAIRRLVKEYPGIEIYLENMFENSPELLITLAERLRDVGIFGLCLDYAHALLNSGEAESWMRRMAPYLRHMHINDHCFESDVHLVPGDGKTDWMEYCGLKERYALEVTVLCEVNGLTAMQRSLEFLKKIYHM